MNTRTKTIASSGVAVGVVAALIAGVYAFSASTPAPEPTATTAAVVHERPATLFADTATVIPAVEEAKAAKAEAERVAAEQAAVQAEADRLAAEQAAADQQQSTPVEVVQDAPAVQAPPVLCPGGSTANSSDGYNDTSCLPDICFSIAIPDAAHPECDAAFRP